MNDNKDKRRRGQGKARNAALINLLVTPGLGSLMAGRIFAGLGQLVVAVAGFALVMIWFVQVMTQYYGLISGQDSPYESHARVGIAGAIVFGVAWLWALATSLGIIREAKR